VATSGGFWVAIGVTEELIRQSLPLPGMRIWRIWSPITRAVRGTVAKGIPGSVGQYPTCTVPCDAGAVFSLPVVSRGSRHLMGASVNLHETYAVNVVATRPPYRIATTMNRPFPGASGMGCGASWHPVSLYG
jgi:hypothetical protein